MKFILGKKEKMTQYFDEQGHVHPATIIKVGPATITRVKNVEKDGYEALQVGFGEQKEKRIPRPVLGAIKKFGNFETLKEIRLETPGEFKEGDVLNVENFEVGDMVTVSGISKGKGFQGVVKRHNFAGGRRSHGQKHSEREPGSIGATGPQRVFKGTKMGGRMGTDRVSVKNLKVLAVDSAQNVILIKGAIPGRRGTLLEIKG
jgi:large subunit ribosomal protein L3